MENIIIPSLIGLLGVVIGTLITSINNQRIKFKETKFRIIEKVVDKRIIDHEDILAIIKNIRTVVPTNQKDTESNIITYPKAMESVENLATFSDEMFFIIHHNSHWLNTNLERELGFFQDYMVTLNMRIKGQNDSNVKIIGLIVKQDFIDLASNLENLTFEFFRKDIYKLKINKHNEWHKYPKEITKKRMNETILFKEFKEIDKIINSA